MPNPLSLLSMAPGMFGQGIAQAAPSPSLGGFSGGLLGDDLARQMALLAKQGNFGMPLSDALQSAPTAQLPETPEDIEADDGPGFLGQLGNMGGGFFDAIDNQFQSPARMLGVGLLNQARPGLGTAGLGLVGLLGAIRNRNG